MYILKLMNEKLDDLNVSKRKKDFSRTLAIIFIMSPFEQFKGKFLCEWLLDVQLRRIFSRNEICIIAVWPPKLVLEILLSVRLKLLDPLTLLNDFK